MYNQTNIRQMQAAVLRRSSSKGQGTSISNQARTVDSVIKEYELRVIREYKLKAVTVALCPGAEADIAKVHLLVEMRFVQQLKYRQIALKLNTERITAAQGGPWSTIAVQQTLLNPIYIGLGIRYRRTQGIYVQGMEKQIKGLRNKIALLSDQLDTDGEEINPDDPVVRKIKYAKLKIAHLKAAIREAGSTPNRFTRDPNVNIKLLADKLEKFGRKIDPSEVQVVRAVLELLISRLAVDLNTKEFELELAFPSWLGNALQGPRIAGLDELLTWKPFIKAHPENQEILGVFQCDADGKPMCYACRRLPKAA